MKNINTLAAMTIGAIFLSATYALAVKGRSFDMTFNNDGGRSVHHIVNGDRGEFVLKDEDRLIKAKWRGEFDLNLEGTNISRLERRLEIEMKTREGEEGVVFERDGADIEKEYFLDGELQSAGEETDAAVSKLLLAFLRASGMKAEERVTAILKKGGASAVFEEMGQLEGDHATRRYSVALSEQAELSDDEIKGLVELLKPVESDHDLSRALQAILEHQTISPELTPILVSAADGVESDHDMRQIVEAFAERPMSSEAMDLALGLYEGIESDHDLRVAAEALLENDALDDAGAARLLQAAADQIDSDHDMRLILTDSATRFASGGAFTDAWFDGLSSIDSSHDKRLCISELADAGGHSTAIWQALIEATETIDSSHDQRLALEDIADQIDGDASLLDAYRKAAAKIGSSHDREQALEAIGDEADD